MALAKKHNGHEGRALGARIALLRKRRGITQQQLADKLGLSRPIVSGYERGHVPVQQDRVTELARLLRVSADVLLKSGPLPPREKGNGIAARVEKRGSTTLEGTAQIGERVALLRKERGITQEQLAERLGLEQTIVSRYERGVLRMHGELIAQLARILRVSGDALLGLDGVQTERLPAVDRRVLRRLNQISKLSRRDRAAFDRFVDAFLSKSDTPSAE